MYSEEWLPQFELKAGGYQNIFLGDARKNALEWLHRIGTSYGGNHDHNVLWGVLAWLPYGRKPGKGSTDWAKLKRWLKKSLDDFELKKKLGY